MGRKYGSSLVLLAAGAAGGLLWGASGSSEPRAQASSVAAGPCLAMVEPSATGGQVLYLVDQNQRTLTVYQYDPNKGKLKLSASRHFGADQQLLEFNNEEPHVADIERLSRSGK